MCESIARVRRKFQRIDKGKMLVLDETYMRSSDAPLSTLTYPGEDSYVETESSSRFAARFDMIACITGKEVLPPMVIAPKKRRKGITAATLINFMRNVLAQAAGALDRYPMLMVLDRSSIHKVAEIKEVFIDWGCQSLTEVVLLPAASAKRLSPLDNALFHDFKENVRKMGKIKKSNLQQKMSDAFVNMEPRLLQAHFRKCGLMRGTDVYFDCPNPAQHPHDI
jgi:hypothetical protein